MGRYWVKIDESVEGPYEIHVLKFINGFQEETLVSPEEEQNEEIWIKANEVSEIKSLFQIREQPPLITPSDLSGPDTTPSPILKDETVPPSVPESHPHNELNKIPASTKPPSSIPDVSTIKPF
ncbi:MAG: hypothetical protein LHV69_11225, partial [Elusimicrobia bacterium]|nr:hypothetical protein [Candidatus Obscuribacterium magneticum]